MFSGSVIKQLSAETIFVFEGFNKAIINETTKTVFKAKNYWLKINLQNSGRS